jgi:Peptidase family C25
MLPQLNSATRINDLQENAIVVIGEQDGIFNDSDYILFYAQATDKVFYDNTSQTFKHEKNIYSDKNYYFLTIGNSDGLRVASQASIAGATQNITTFNEFFYYEKDLFNVLFYDPSVNNGSGREWYGEQFDGTLTYNFTYNTEGIVPNSPIQFTSAVLGNSVQNSYFDVKINGAALGRHTLTPLTQGTYQPKGFNSVLNISSNTGSIANLPNFGISYTYIRSDFSQGYLNYFEVNYQRNLRLYGSQTSFRSIQSLNTPVSDFSLTNADANTQIWDITNPLQPINQLFSLQNNTAIFGANTSTLKEFVAWTGNNFTAVERIAKISNQNLHNAQAPDLLIITHPIFLAEAERLAQFRRDSDGFSVLVTTTDQIYNEFSSGKQDLTALRDFNKYLYLKNPSKFKYVLLFGGCSFDYKDRIQNNTNFVPIYESRESLHPIYSYSSDDYLGFLEASEGTWTETQLNTNIYDHTLEIGVGRLPVRTLQEATDVVNKLIRYKTPQAIGDWRKKLTFIADDEDGNLHLNDADTYGTLIESNYPNFNVNKVYLDAYPQQTTPSGETCVGARDALHLAVERGSLIVNYTGHGGELGWTQEGILTEDNIKDWKNTYQLPLFITATCQFGRYDNPTITSGAEKLLLMPNGGAIGLITTTRPVYSSTNFLLNSQIYNFIFQPIAGQMPRLGDLIRLTKNNSLSGSINRNFSLLADPSMRLAYPEKKAVLTKINGKDISLPSDTIKALSKIALEGEIKNDDNSKITDFQGIVKVVVWDKNTSKTTLGNRNTTPIQFLVRESKLFEGTATVKDGNFKTEFVAPKDLNYNFGTSKISIYAQRNDNLQDASGGNINIKVGGSTKTFVVDNQAPQIQLFMNDISFKNGDLVGQNPSLLALLSDENGINISQSGIGHSIEVYLNDSTSNTRILNDFYTADLDTYKSGKVKYPFQSLTDGNYTLTLKAWDTYNNSNSAKINFLVASNAKIALQKIYNYPNPVTDKTTFLFQHNRAGEDLEIELEIVNSQGQSVMNWKYSIPSAPNSSEIKEWDGTVNGNPLPQGIYVYRVLVRSLKDGQAVTATNRLVILK